MPDRTLVVTATVETTDETHLARAVEVLSRAGTGLALDGIEVAIERRRP